ncbi:hypothetical protein OSB04_un001325 [Centaurea solstitialis]|uniref:ATP synthase protein MI25 n=2 Tax=Asteraceae TaxID=4210 RepID=A0AA38S3F9_9ASTR|nr:hypothetical protein OSB04_un001325 [Centaurea solstitialis]
MRLSSTNMQARKMLFAAILSICASSSKKISIYNEEMIVARCFIGFIIFSRKSLGKTFKVTLDGRIQAIQEESQQFLNPNEVVPPESNEQQRLLRISLRICGTVVESLPMARSAPKCEKTVQALLCRNLNVKSATLPNATSSRRIRLQDDLVTGFHFSVSERFVPGSTLKASIVELIREGLVVLRMKSGSNTKTTSWERSAASTLGIWGFHAPRPPRLFFPILLGKRLGSPCFIPEKAGALGIDYWALNKVSSFLHSPIIDKTGKDWSSKEGIPTIDFRAPVLFNFFLDEFDRAFEEQFPKMPHARYDYEICIPLGIGKWKEFHVPKWEELLNGLGLVGKVFCLVPGGDPVTCIGAFISVDDNGFIQIIETGSLE